MAISETVRARIILDLLKDGNVANETPYSSVDLAAASMTLKYAQAMWDNEGPGVDGSGNPISTPTNAQLAAFFLKRLRVKVKQTLNDVRTRAAMETAAATEKAAVLSEVLADIGGMNGHNNHDQQLSAARFIHGHQKP